MANAQTVTTLEAVHEGIIAAIRRRFPELLTVEAYRMDRKNLPVPACLVELTEMEGADDLDPGTGQLAVNARFEARFVLGFRQGSRKDGSAAPDCRIHGLGAPAALGLSGGAGYGDRRMA